MNLQLPKAIATFFEVSNGDDISRIADCFTHDAVVRDKDLVYQGHHGIAAWVQNILSVINFRIVPVDASADDNRVIVVTKVVGEFPGSPVKIDHIFELASDKILSLEVR
jgi:hypothetical protein